MSDKLETMEIECDAGAVLNQHFLRVELTGEFHVSGTVEAHFLVEEEEVAAEVEAEETPPYDAPVHPFYIDEDGDICDAHGWLVMVLPYGVWPDTEHHAQTVLKALNKHPFLTPDEMRDKRRVDKRRVDIQRMLCDRGRSY